MKVAVESRRISGPIPHPELLAGYEAVEEGAAGRIITQFERFADTERQIALLQARTDRHVDLIDAWAPIIRTSLAQLCALAVAIFGLWVAYRVAIAGQPWAAGVIAVCDLGFLVAAFLYSGILNQRADSPGKQRPDESTEGLVSHQVQEDHP